eukprot:GHVS01007665.1.p1 GENE.GHVS01007665.1~~GHVS01007665.1.p1  ORF type:complete len:333 (+),score=40.22 GHVS01007665.1:106-1104(+)
MRKSSTSGASPPRGLRVTSAGGSSSTAGSSSIPTGGVGAGTASPVSSGSSPSGQYKPLLSSLKLVAPLNIPYGTILVDYRQPDKPKHFFHFERQYPSARNLFTIEGAVCDVFASHLEIELLYIGCKVENVEKVADLVNAVAPHCLPYSERPIRLRCSGLQWRSQSWNVACPDVYEVPCQVVTVEDREHLSRLANLTQWLLEALQEAKLATSVYYLTDMDSLAVAVRKFVRDPPAYGVDHYKQYVVEDVQLSEVKLINTKPNSVIESLAVDPRYEPHRILTRPIVSDSRGNPARHAFAEVRASKVVKKSKHFALRKYQQNSGPSSDSSSDDDA